MAMAGVSGDPRAMVADLSAAADEDMARAAKIATVDPHSEAEGGFGREKFLPVTRHALLDRLTSPNLWPEGEAAQARRFLRYLDYWRRHSYAMRLVDIEQTYEPFSPDSDLIKTRAFTPEERAAMQARLVDQVADLLTQANFTRVEPSNVHFILTKDSAYGLDLQVDLDAFEECLIYYRGATTITERRRDVKRAYMRWKEVKIPVFQRLCLLFKLKPFDVRVREVMAERKIETQGGRADRAPAARSAAGDRHQRLRLHQAFQEYAAQRRGDDLPQHQGALPDVRQDQVRRHRQQRRRHGPVRHPGQDRGGEQSLYAGAAPRPGSAASRCARPPAS